MKTSAPFFGFLSFLISSCAIQVVPGGGTKDISPPQVLKSIPANFSTNFSGQDISLTFDEYIQLKDLPTQLVVSPPLKNFPETKIRKRTLTIHISDTLAANSTYTMNFGKAIVDNNEGTPLENFQYVFSTGNVLDSLSLSGNVENAFDKKTAKGIFVLLYKQNVDSLPYKNLPDYFARTDDDGNFKITNIANASYKIFALKETNNNYLYDSNDESIAFDDSSVVAEITDAALNLFKEIPKQQLLKSGSEEPGKAVIVYSRPLKNLQIFFLKDTAGLNLAFTEFSMKKDSITFWYKNLLTDTLHFVISHDENKQDTILMRLFKIGGKSVSRNSQSLTTNITAGTEILVEPTSNAELRFNHPILKYDFSKISLFEDSILQTNFNIFFSDSLKKNLAVEYKWREKKLYNLNIPSGTFTDIFGLWNDTMIISFRSINALNCGTLALSISLPSRNKQFVVQLIDDAGNVFRQSIILSDTILNYEYLNPQSYRLKVIEDENKNGEWDTGNYLKHNQPEKIFFYKEPITVRANWDVDVKWDLIEEK